MQPRTKVFTLPPAAQPLPCQEEVGHQSQLSQKQYHTQAWPVQHKAQLKEDCHRHCLSEPLPETDCYHLASLMHFMVWVAPWGEVIYMVSDQILTTQEGSPQLSRVDSKLLSVVSKTTATPSPPTSLSLSYPNYSTYIHHARDILFDPVNIMMD